jgi:hypothetical protein
LSKRNVTWFFGADASKFVQASKQVERNLDNISRMSQRAGSTMSRVFTAPIMAAGGALMAATVKAAEFADNIDKMSMRTGVSREQLQELSYVTDQLGVSMAAVETAADAFRRRLPQIESGSGAASDIMQKLGVSVRGTDGNLRSMNELLPELIGKLARVPNETERSAMSLQLFGRSASQLAPLLNAGADQIDALSDRARELGLVMGDDAVADLVKFKDAMSEVKQQMGAAGRELGMILLPVIQDEFIPFVQNQAIPAVRDFARRFAEMDTEGKKQVIMWAGIIAAAGPGLIVFGQLTKVISGTTVALRTLLMLAGANPFGATIIATTTMITLLHTLSRRALEARDALVEAYRVGEDAEVPGTEEFGRMIGMRMAGLLQEQALGAQVGKQRLEQLEEEIGKYRRLLQLNAERMQQSVQEAAAIQQVVREHARLREAIEAVGQIQTHNYITGKAMTLEQIQLLERHGNAVEALGNKLREVQVPAGELPEDFTRMDTILSEIIPLGYNFAYTLSSGLATAAVNGENLMKTLGNITKQLGSQVLQRGLMLLLTGGMSGVSGFWGDGGGLFGKLLGGLTGNRIPVNDALITSGGQIVQFHPDDNILAMKDLSKLPASGGGGDSHVHITGTLVARGDTLVGLIENAKRVYR